MFCCRYRNGQLIYPKPIKTVPVYEGRKEVDNLDELNELISDPDEMRMQVSLDSWCVA